MGSGDDPQKPQGGSAGLCDHSEAIVAMSAYMAPARLDAVISTPDIPFHAALMKKESFQVDDRTRARETLLGSFQRGPMDLCAANQWPRAASVSRPINLIFIPTDKSWLETSFPMRP